MLKDEATAEFMGVSASVTAAQGRRLLFAPSPRGWRTSLVNSKARNAFVGAADNLFVLKQDNFDKARLIAQEKEPLRSQELQHLQSVNTILPAATPSSC